MRAVVITPTTGIPELSDAIKSVASQTVKVDHYVVIDGMEHAEKAIEICKQNQYGQQVIMLPENTGKPTNHWIKEGAFFWGHRIYLAMTYLTNHDYILFLDQDNWYEPEHCEVMLKSMEDNRSVWCYSLRNIVNLDGEFQFRDDCDSLGIFPNQSLVSFADMNCYCFKTSYALEVIQKHYDNYHCDRQMFSAAFGGLEDPRHASATGLYTVNYRAKDEAIENWFRPGLEKIKKYYGDNKPWSAEWNNK